MSPNQILIIHDDILEDDPLIVELGVEFGRENVALEARSSIALDKIRERKGEKFIVLLDFDLGTGEPHAPDVLMAIREFTSLIYVIVYTAKQFSDIAAEDLVAFINNDAFAIIQNTTATSNVIELVKRAAHSLDTRVDSVLEQWISKRSEEELVKPYLITPDGHVFSLRDLQGEIRRQTPVGKELERSILQLAIKMLGE